MAIRYLQRFCVPIFIFLHLCNWTNGKCQERSEWRIKNRLQTTYEFDNNIREFSADTLDKIGDSSFKFIFHSKAARLGKKSRLLFSYQGGLQTYFQNPIENKLINEFNGVWSYAIHSFMLGFQGEGRLKIYLNDIFDYATGAGEVFIQLPPVFKFRNQFAFQVSGLNYQNFTIFDYAENQFAWSLSRQLASRLSGQLTLSTARIHYDRLLLRFAPPDTLTFRQNDQFYQAQVQLNYSESFLINFNYKFQYNNSNNPEFDYYNHQLILIFGFPLPRNFWLRSYGALQFKHYKQTIPREIPRDIDPEREESSFFIMDLSKDLNQNLTALIRFAYYDNESVIRSRFYRKALLSVGADYRF